MTCLYANYIYAMLLAIQYSNVQVCILARIQVHLFFEGEKLLLQIWGVFVRFCLFSKICSFLLERHFREIERCPICWFISQMAATATAKLIWRQEPAGSSRSPTWVQGPKDLSPAQLLSQAIMRKLEGEMSTWAQTGTDMGSQHLTRKD